ncbi:imidazolonepropionase [Rhodobacter sp. KR11]|uniref:imidazolonepropionase n=1 Tax=Rhodobacter sp. KR11 TaxID=2974588 RepID=UPI002223B277|nr:imidazolonepropionase [Rhodobacter sp. KR11]MCW1919631.1 imidazolonepropionase [Rhodobacter sp. KR11]
MSLPPPNLPLVLTNATIATMETGYGLGPTALVAERGVITWIGTDLPERYAPLARDLGGALVTPGLVDAHSHIVFGGNRAAEFEQRLNGASYEDVARAGGGILSTVRATRAASEESLLEQSLTRADALIVGGVTTLEIKSGYGLTVQDELKMLRVAREIGRARRLRVVTTHLAAHAVPPEYQGRAMDYITEVAVPSLRLAAEAGLVDAVDAFCEKIAFQPTEVERLFQEARALGLPVKLHAEQLSDLGGAALAARFGALSADHLEHLSPEGIAAMKAAGTVAQILPGAFYTLRETQLPPIAALRAAGVPMAVASDCNPGSSPMTSLTLAMNMACTLFRMTPLEALQGTTLHAARALGLTCGIRVGAAADLCIWNALHPAELSYKIGQTPLARIFGGHYD